MGFHKQQIVNRYLPRTLIRHWEHNPEQDPIWGEWLTGSLMHCDVTGFTAMSEALANAGNEGAEFMAGILNRFFERMLGIADEWGGMQMKFGGDAMLLYFQGESHASQATACGLEMQAAMKEFRNIPVMNDQYTLRMRIGIHSGQFYSASVGQITGLLHYLLFGQDVNRAADVEPKADPGQVVVSSESLKQLDENFKFRETGHKDIHQVTRHQYSNKYLDSTYSVLNSNPQLHRYLIPPIAAGKAGSLTGEHRRVTIAFIYLQGASQLLKDKGPDEALKQVNSYLNSVIECMEKYGGYLITSDVSEHGDKFLVAFGAPVSSGQQENDALNFSCELNEKLATSHLDLHHQIGINSGYVFAGEIGSTHRREYTTIGDTTNLAARLMGVAKSGEIVVSAKAFNKCESNFEAIQLDPVRVKGKSEPVEIFRVISTKQLEQAYLPMGNTDPVFGRSSELHRLSELAHKCRESNSACGIYIFGESGIGKSRLCLEYMQDLQRSGWTTLPGICQSYNSRNAYSAWFYPLRKLFGITINDTDEIAWGKIVEFIQAVKPDLEVFSPLIAEILAVNHDPNPVTKSLDAKTRREKRTYTILELIIAKALNSPVALYFDNSQWLDSSSVELINTILESGKESILICLSSREDIKLSESGPVNSEKLSIINLQGIHPSAAYKLLQHYGVDPQFVEQIIERAKGNPLFLEELAHSSLDDSSGSLPETVYDVVMSRLDNLDNIKKSLLKNASVLGQIFDSALLTDLAKDVKELSHEKG